MIYSLLYAFIFVFQELIYKIFTGNALNMSFITTILYVVFMAFMLGLITDFIPGKARKYFFGIVSFIIVFFYGASLIMYRTFGIIITLSSFKLAGNFTGDFIPQTIRVLTSNFFLILLIISPYVLSLFACRFINDYRKDKYGKAFSLVIGLLSFALFFLIAILSPDSAVYEQYFLRNNYIGSVKNIGVLPTFVISGRKDLTGFAEKINTVDNTEDIEVEYDKQILDIPFDTLESDDETINSMNAFFNSEICTYKNEYTGMFEGKNLIYIMAESFDGYMVSEELTPTLYKMIHSGFDFTNYYSPTNLSTIGGEFSLLTGLLPDLNCLNRQWIRSSSRYDNYYPYGLADIFKNQGYKTYAYHDHEYDFQSRNVYLESLGFDNYLGCWNGLEERMGCTIFPKSDDEMIMATYQDYINDDQFMVYYATVSGHGGWYFGDNDMADKNRDLVEDLPYSDTVKAYIAGNLELEKAMTSLLQVLEENGRLEDTVIILAADHHPYFLLDEEVEEMAGKTLDKFELYRNNLIIYNCDVETTKIDKVCNTIDVFPTMLNLFNIPYDSRIIIGKDIMSDNEGLVIYADYSWKSDLGEYDSATDTFYPDIYFDNVDDYVRRMNNIVNGRYQMSEYIMIYDYYRIIKDFLN
ncbi:MAG: LTA synthase family protein [Erysipelotrichaceae bacterium]|nr:LTA synthase family protein [Erysipelotrichaceae bacterium]